MQFVAINMATSPYNPKAKIKRCKNPFESPSCPETYQQASSSTQSAELFHYISMSPEDFNQQLKDGSTPNRLASTKPRSRLPSTRTSTSSELENPEAIGDELFFETPCKQVAQLNLHDTTLNKQTKKSTPRKKAHKKKAKGSKLLGSKSLSQLISKLNRRTSTEGTDHDEKGSKQTVPIEQTGKKTSLSLILHRQSTSKTLAQPLNSTQNFQTTTICNGPDISPIIQSQTKIIRDVVATTPSLPLNRHRESIIDCRLRSPKNTDKLATSDSKTVSKKQKDDKRADKAQKEDKPAYRPFKNTALVLRDVKNSLRLRLKARRDNQEFEQLTNESMTSATPDVKLYSPFTIDTPSLDSENKISKRARRKDTKSKRRLNLIGDQNQTENLPGADATKTENATSSNLASNKSLKTKIALRHKKHLMQTSKSVFESPTGRLRETVRDVEQLQKCIEDISQAIKARGANCPPEIDVCPSFQLVRPNSP